MRKVSSDLMLTGVTACFTGHRKIPDEIFRELEKRIDESIEYLWQKGYRRFFCGGALGFDTMAANRVIKFRRVHPEIELILAIPCYDQADRWSKPDVDSYMKIKAEASDVRILSPHYYEGCMDVRNRYMVNRSSCCISYLHGFERKSGTWSTVAYAVQSDVPVLNLAVRKDLRMAAGQTNGKYISAGEKESRK